MTSDTTRMNTEEKHETNSTSPQNTTRPRLLSYQSSSVPATPRQHAREFTSNGRSPSPTGAMGHHSPRSVSSEANRNTASFRPTNPSCRFQSTQTSRRRIPYSIGADPLPPESQEPKLALSDTEEKSLTADIKALYEELLPTEQSQANRRKILDKLRKILREEWPENQIEVSVFGSSGNLLYTNKSDVDVCITMKSFDTVCSLAEVLSKKGMKNVTCVHAKAVPIVKIWDPELQIACDLNVNNHIALKNTRLVRAYMELDERVRPLAMIVKYWTKKRIINEASGGTLSSYTWTLLVINFLQTRDIPVLPKLSPCDEEGRPKEDFSADVQENKEFGKRNEQSLGELLFYFFRWYGHAFDYDGCVISVREARLLTKKEKNWTLASNNRLCVEEPFNTDRNLGNTADDTAFRGLHLELRQAFSRIAEAKSLVSSICEQYEFPVEEHKSIFERPQPGPKPILSRSTSQSGRGGRGGGGRRGNRQQFDSRNGINARRSSSAATFGGNIPPILHSPQLVLPSNSGYSEELNKLSMQEQQLRARHDYLSQIQAQHSLQQGSVVVPPHGPGSPMPTPQRHAFNGYPSPRLSTTDSMPGSAQNVQGYPFPSAYESAVAMSHSSSQQGTNTNPNSPMLAPATPNRRGFQRSAALNSPGAAVRSQSQPARPLQPPFIQQNGARAQYPNLVYPQVHGTSVWPSNLPRPAYYGPYVGAMGVHYVAVPQMDNIPREYLGYGINQVPQFGQFAQQSAVYQQPQGYADPRQQDGQSSPTRQPSSLSLSSVDIPRSTSPLARSESQVNGLNSAPVTATFPGYQQGSQLGERGSDDGTPMIVNGSYPMVSRAQTLDNGENLEHRRLSNTSRLSKAPSELSLADIGTFRRGQRSSRSSSHQSDNEVLAINDDDTPIAENGPSSRNLPRADADEPAIARSTTDMPPPPRPNQSANNSRSPLSQFSPEAAAGHRRLNGGTRQNIPPLDLGKTSAERLRESAPNTATVLSPVEETRTPSPVNSRRHNQRKSVQLNGMTVPTPPTPMPTRGEKLDGAGTMNGNAGKKPGVTPATGSGHGRSSSVINVGSSNSAQQSNQWQQANTGKKKNKQKGGQTQSPSGEKKKGGEAMPADETARKGG